MKLPFEHTVSLSQMENVRLMNRMDTKFWFHVDRLPEILEQIKQHYYMLEINGNSQLPYSTVYYDTPDNAMYLAHHNGRLNRFKVRKRTYVDSEVCFLEIKRKNNKGKTLKERIPSCSPNKLNSSNEVAFISANSPFHPEKLVPKLKNEFTRITLVSGNQNERCTIDLNLAFQAGGKRTETKDLVIVEVKTEGTANHSLLVKYLHEAGISASGFSKYCMGRLLTDRTLKHNSFKFKLSRLAKTACI